MKKVRFIMNKGEYKNAAVVKMFILTVIALTGFVQSTKASQSSGSSVTTPQEKQENPAIQNSEPNFTIARESFQQKNYKAAAEEIRKGIKFMKEQESRAKEAGKKMLTASIDELDTLAKNIEQGTVTTVNTLDNAFARARDSIASNAHVKNVQTKTSEAAKDASSGLKQGLSWTGEKISTAASETAKGTGFVIGKIIEGTGWLGKKTGHVLNFASDKIENFGKNIQPKKQETQTQNNEPVNKE
jgi:hypothetical protein